MEAEEWVAGRTAGPVLVSLRQAYVPSKQRDLKVSRRTLLHDSRATATASGATTPPPTPPAAPASTRFSAPPVLGSGSATVRGQGGQGGQGGVVGVGGAVQWVRLLGWAMGGCGRWVGPWAVGVALLGVSPDGAVPQGGRLEEVLEEVAALRALVAEQGQRISRLEEQLSRLENGHV